MVKPIEVITLTEIEKFDSIYYIIVQVFNVFKPKEKSFLGVRLPDSSIPIPKYSHLKIYESKSFVNEPKTVMWV